MKPLCKFQALLFAAAFLLLAWPAQAQTRWQIQDGYRIYFDGSGAEGTFKELKGTIRFDPQRTSKSQFDVTIDPASIATGNDTKNKHARGENWFDVATYPKIRFVSNRILRDGDGFRVKGELTMHGVTKEIAFPFDFEQKGNTARFEGKLSIDREKFGIDGPMMAFMVGDLFDVRIEVPAKKSPAN